MSNPYEQQRFALPGPRLDQPSPPQPGQLPYPPQQVHYLPSQPPPQWQPSPAVPKQRHGLAVTALVVSCLALVLVLGLIVFVVVTGFFSPPGELQGTAPQVLAGQPYKGPMLADELSRVITADYGEVESMTCPETAVKPGVVVNCHGVVDGYDSTVSVHFQDVLGHFTLVED